MGRRGSQYHEPLLGRELRSWLLSKALWSSHIENRKGEECHKNPNSIRSLCHHALNDPGPKFNTHLGHSCGTLLAHLSGINIPREIEKKKNPAVLSLD